MRAVLEVNVGEMKYLSIVLLCTFLSGCSRQEEGASKLVVAVKVARAETADLALTVRAPATVFPREQANVSARITAPIAELRARKGDVVKAGQVLAVLENRDILAQRQEAHASVSDAEANLQKLSAGTLPTDIERARGQVKLSEASLNQAQKYYERRAELYKQGAIPGRDLLASETDLAHAKANYQVAKESLKLLEGQSRDKDIAIAQSRVAQAKARLALAEAQLQFTELRSPSSGVITEQFLYPGDLAKPEAPVFTVMDLSTVVVRAQVPETDVVKIKPGQSCSFDALEATVSGAGKITVVNKAVDPARRTVEVWCEMPNAGGRIRAGVFGNVAVVTGTARNAVLVPLAAVQFVEGTQTGSVYVVDSQKIAHKKDVEIGGATDRKVQINKGINAGDVVIVEGGYGLPDGTQVNVLEGGK
jgi:multidrug efflux pump subunit AcrA (membrane-fusion protein)